MDFWRSHIPILLCYAFFMKFHSFFHSHREREREREREWLTSRDTLLQEYNTCTRQKYRRPRSRPQKIVFNNELNFFTWVFIGWRKTKFKLVYPTTVQWDMISSEKGNKICPVGLDLFSYASFHLCRNFHHSSATSIIILLPQTERVCLCVWKPSFLSLISSNSFCPHLKILQIFSSLWFLYIVFSVGKVPMSAQINFFFIWSYPIFFLRILHS